MLPDMFLTNVILFSVSSALMMISLIEPYLLEAMSGWDMPNVARSIQFELKTEMFAILLIVTMFSQGLTIVSYGRSFITAFPENLAYFYPNTLSCLRVTALYDDTFVNIFHNGSSTPTKSISDLQKGQTVTVVFPKSAEVYQLLNYSTKSIQITSNKYIAVQSITQTDYSTQTNVVQPSENLGMNYLIPSLNYTNLLATFSVSQSASFSTKYNSFRLIIINAEDTENNITIVKNILGKIQLVNFTIPPYQLIQLQADDSMMMVNSSCKIAVLLTHPCLLKADCKCSMIVNQILPVRFQGQNFVVPFIPEIKQSWLFMTSNNKASSLSQKGTKLTSSSGFLSLSDPGNPQYVTASSNVSLRLISPGLFIELIQENMFAGCYLLQSYTNTFRIHVIAETVDRDHLNTDKGFIQSLKWTEISGTKYSSVEFSLNNRASTTVWHSSSKIAVYILEETDKIVYGGPAIPIKENPDPSGCKVPGEFVVGDKPLKWTKSLAYCTNPKREFACPTNRDIQMELARQVNTTNVEGWIGLRRSLMTTAWFWQKQTSSSTSPPVNYVYWAKGQSQKGFCASLSLDGSDFKWKSASCCEKKLPVCYKPPLTIGPLSWSDSTDFP
ncbi:IgGFc-binding protein-like [Paramisgurnus dabryanus]|uniref:IgGFc-binding protein-like n=1 Tax=Paramisgurnus dabryanus TaxID=90735 RepID=UPI0031F389C9